MIEMAGPWITKLEEDYVLDAIRHGWYGKNKYYYCEKLEEEFANYHNRKYAIMTPNCTSAIHLLIMALGIKDDDEVLVPECTWIASCSSLSYVRAKPVFVDINVDNWCIDPKSVEKNITEKTKAIIAVDLFGNMPHMNQLIDISNKYNIPIIEDAAEALGSTYDNVKAGKFGIGSVFSFHRTKTMTTGEGGMLLTDDDDIYNRCSFLRDHGRDPEKTYVNLEAAYKYMPFNLQAALGLAQFRRLDELVSRKREQLHLYKDKLKNVPDIQLNNEEKVYNGAWITGLVIGKSYNLNSSDMIDKLFQMGIPSRPFFYPLSSLPAYKHLGEPKTKENPQSFSISSRGINLPGAANVGEEEITKITNAIKKILNDHTI